MTERRGFLCHLDEHLCGRRENFIRLNRALRPVSRKLRLARKLSSGWTRPSDQPSEYFSQVSDFNSSSRSLVLLSGSTMGQRRSLGFSFMARLDNKCIIYTIKHKRTKLSSNITNYCTNKNNTQLLREQG